MRTALRTGMGTSERPMTSNKGAGYSKSMGKDPKELEYQKKLNFAKKGPLTKEQQNKEAERKVQKIFDESIMLKCRKDYGRAREKCLEAYEELGKIKDQNNDYFNVELEFGIRLNMALIYQGLNMLDDAKTYYQELLTQESYFNQAIQFQRIRINLGNIYFQSGEFKKAITEYKRAIDKTNKENKELRANIMKNVALANIKLGNYNDAIESFAESFRNNPDIRTAMNLLLCHLALGSIENTKSVFNLMLEVSEYGVIFIN